MEHEWEAGERGGGGGGGGGQVVAHMHTHTHAGYTQGTPYDFSEEVVPYTQVLIYRYAEIFSFDK